MEKSTAKVNRYQNLYIFTDCEPIMEYEYLGTVKVIMSWSGQYQPIRDALIKKGKNKFPNAEGIILNFQYGRVDRADVIKFK